MIPSYTLVRLLNKRALFDSGGGDMHHKRKGPKSTRAGCLLCKPHKRQGTEIKDRQRFSQTRQEAVAREKIREFHV